MGNKFEFKLSVLIALFLVTCVLVYWNAESAVVEKKPAMWPFLMQVEGYKIPRQANLPEDAVKMLKLDDYTFADYDGPNGRINLYIGYYLTAGKAYASHSPLVCYPSQGWKIKKEPVVQSMTVGPNRINYEEIITSYGKQTELVLYWYQSRLLTSTHMYINKLEMAYNKLAFNNQQHAFVRVAVPIGNGSYKEAKNAAVDFIRAFYPNFIKFIKSTPMD